MIPFESLDIIYSKLGSSFELSANKGEPPTESIERIVFYRCLLLLRRGEAGEGELGNLIGLESSFSILVVNWNALISSDNGFITGGYWIEGNDIES